jgi:Skp family chaperone for outer membrane proteins
MSRKFVRFSLLSIFVFLFLLGTNAFAAPEQLKIATISIQDILTNSVAGKEGQKVLEAKLKSYEEKFKGSETALEALAQEIDKKKSVWDAELLAEKQRDFQKSKRDYELARQDAQADLQQLEKQVMEPILKDLHDIIAEIGKKEGYTLIFENTMKGLQNRTGLLYAADSLNISATVQKALDAKAKK